MMIEQYVRLYRKLGLNILPAEHKKKHPIMPTWKRYQRARATDDEVEEWLKKGMFQNINVCLGETSKLWEIDVDVENAVDKLGHLTAKALVCESSEGKVKLFFRTNVSLPNKKDVEVEGGHVELRGENHLSVLPPSIHPTGSTYEWLNKEIDGVPVLDGEAFYESIITMLGGKRKPVVKPKFETVSPYPAGNIRTVFIRSFLRGDDWSGCSGHSFRLAVCAEFINAGYDNEVIHRFFSTHDEWSGEDYNETVTQKKINELRKKGMKNWTMQKLSEQCPEQVRE
jgi:hypothetical protein